MEKYVFLHIRDGHSINVLKLYAALTKHRFVCVLLSNSSACAVAQGVVCTLHEGDDFGKLALVNDAPRAASIVLREDNCHFLRVEKEDYNRILRVRFCVFHLMVPSQSRKVPLPSVGQTSVIQLCVPALSTQLL